MEKMRRELVQDAYLTLQPLGRHRPTSGRGVVSEDLGHTEFKTSSKTNNAKSSKHTQVSPVVKDDTGEDDDLDLLSSSDALSPPRLPAHRKAKASKRSESTSNMKPPGSRTKVKPRPNFQSIKALHAKEKSKGAPQRSPPSPKAVHSTSPLEELSPNSIKGAKKSRKTCATQPFPMQDECHATKTPKGTREPQPFPMQDECHTAKKSKGNREPRPFPMQDECHAAKKSKGTREPQPFPMQDECHTAKRSRGARELQPFPMQDECNQTEVESTRHGHVPSSIHSPCKPSSSKTQIVCSKYYATRVSQRFSLGTASPSSFQGNDDDKNDDDELALTDDDNNVIEAYGAPRPFPMSLTQYLPKTTDASGSKRSAEDSDEERITKRSRPSPEPNAFGNLSSLSLEDDVDPTTICPYCDEPWPSTPSPTLLSLLERTKRKSYVDPRPGNTLGLMAPLAVFVEVCQRHRFEMTHLPLALERGWPTRLDFASLPERIRRFRKQLRQFIDHPVESEFWREIRDDVKEIGKMKVMSVSGQYATFERCQPGYYGEQGSIIIHQTLYSLFSSDTIPLTSVDPLTADQFLTRVLVPETAVLLIQEDMHLSTKAETMRVLDESKKYGTAMFPEQAQEEEVAEIGERLAKERAKERRKVLEKRGEADTDVKKEVERERRQARKEKKGRGFHSDTEREKGRVTESESEAEHRGEDEPDSEPSTRKAGSIANYPDSNVPFGKKRSKQKDKSREARRQDTSDELTPRPLRGGAMKGSSSHTSRRSRCSPTSSPDRHHGLIPASQSLHKSSCRSTSSPPRCPNQECDRESQWVFNFRADASSSDRSDVDLDDMTAWYVKNEGKAGEVSNTDSDVVVMEDELTPKSKPRRRQAKPSRAVHGPVVNNSSDSDVRRNRATSKSTCRQGAEMTRHQDAAGSGTLGKTRRKGRGNTRDNATASDSEGGTSLTDVND